MNYMIYIKPIIGSIVYTVLGMVLFVIALLIMQKVAPFSIRKEIEEDQNTALAILMGSIFLALAIIIHAAIT
jgi:putative membrane protein